mmetsp:Transcript_19845/g.30577  ORF Transcript_19845/g.30577 Transcript_19845/m.30577 type:complete len:117 (+) Transcript_19845:775-1125(+)
MKAFDLLPQDVCPSSQDKKFFLEVGRNRRTTFEPLTFYNTGLFQFSNRPVNIYFKYTISMKLYFTEHLCHVQDPNRAVDVCHLLKIDKVLVLYKTSPTTARFHFFAEKAYYEKRSK